MDELADRRRQLSLHRILPADLIIAASAIQAGAVVYHVDGHFDSIAQHSDLRARHLLPKDSEE